MKSRFALRACLIAFALAGSTAAHALLFRAYLSSTGSDTNACTVGAPCRLLPAALDAVADGGEIWILDSANFNTSAVVISKSVTILAIPGVVGSVVAVNSNNAMEVNAPGIRVSLRNLVVRRLSGDQNGIQFSNGASLEIAGCEIAGLQGFGIFATATGTTVAIRDTVVRGSGAVGVHVGQQVSATLERVRLQSNGYGVYVLGGGRVTIDRSVLSGNGFGALADGGQGTARLVIERSLVTGNNTGVLGATASGMPGSAEITLRGNSFTHQVGIAVQASQNTDRPVIVVADDNVLSENGTAFTILGGAIIYTRGNNTALFNGTDVFGGSLTPLTAQ